MRWIPGTLVWVKCEDGVWWPAKVADTDERDVRAVESTKDMCVEFYHHPGVFYAVLSTDRATLREFHGSVFQRTEEELVWFGNSQVSIAVSKALADVHAVHHQPEPAYSKPFSEEEVAHMYHLVHSVCPSAVAGLPPIPNVRKRARPPPTSTDALPRSRSSVTLTRPYLSQPTRPSVAINEPDTDEDIFLPRSVQPNVQPSARPATPPPATRDDAVAVTSSPYVRPLNLRSLDSIVEEAFKNEHSFTLSPAFKFARILGALKVSSTSVRTSISLPPTLDDSMCVLVLPLTSQAPYRSDIGWMQPFSAEDIQYTMRLSIEGHHIEVPTNWNVSAGKESRAVKTAPVLDITSLLDRSASAFSLEVIFPSDRFDEEMELWTGIIACISTHRVPQVEIESQIIQRCLHTAHPSTNTDSTEETVVVEGSMSIRCPLTTALIRVPARSRHCEHLQCMELSAVLSYCIRSNLWNCPICAQPLKPEDFLVHHRLQEWLQLHHSQLPDVEYVTDSHLHGIRGHFYQRTHPRHFIDIDTD